MSSGFKSQVVPSYRLLTEEQIQELHRATLETLSTVGTHVSDDEALAMLNKAGCQVTGDHQVTFPAGLVEDAIKSAPSWITIYDRQGKEAMRLEGRNSYYGMGTDLIHTFDIRTNELRPTVLQDVINAARVADYCNDVDFIASMGLPHDVPTNSMYIECVRAMLRNSTKPIFTTAGGAEDLAVIIEMAETVVGGEQALRDKPIVIHYSEPTPPLVHSYGAIRKLFLCADKGVPITYVPGGILGGTSPVTLAGGGGTAKCRGAERAGAAPASPSGCADHLRLCRGSHGHAHIHLLLRLAGVSPDQFRLRRPLPLLRSAHVGHRGQRRHGLRPAGRHGARFYHADGRPRRRQPDSRHRLSGPGAYQQPRDDCDEQRDHQLRQACHAGL